MKLADDMSVHPRFSFGFSFRQDSAQSNSPVFGNRRGYTSKDPGFSIVQRKVGQLEFSIGDGSKQVIKSIEFASQGGWVYVAMTVDTIGRNATVYCASADSHNVRIETLDLAGIDLKKIIGVDSTIGFNENSLGTYYSSGRGVPGRMTFDNVNMWRRVLTEREVRYLASAQRSLPEMLPSTEGVSTSKPIIYGGLVIS